MRGGTEVLPRRLGYLLIKAWCSREAVPRRHSETSRPSKPGVREILQRGVSEALFSCPIPIGCSQAQYRRKTEVFASHPIKAGAQERRPTRYHVRCQGITVLPLEAAPRLYHGVIVQRMKTELSREAVLNQALPRRSCSSHSIWTPSRGGAKARPSHPTKIWLSQKEVPRRHQGDAAPQQ